MSYNNKSNSNNKVSPSLVLDNKGKKPFCKVCHDAGKTESEYTSHFVRSLPDINGKSKITCPVLAATKCRYCYEAGHTTKFCPILEENNKRSKKEKSVTIQYQRAEERAFSRTVPEPVVERKYTGAFAALGDDDDSDSEDKKPVPKKPVPKVVALVDDFPALKTGSKKAVLKCSTEGSFASTDGSRSWAAIAEKPAAPVLKLKPIVKYEIKNMPQIACKSWADDYDSDSEEEKINSAPLVRPAFMYQVPSYDTSSECTNDAW